MITKRIRKSIMEVEAMSERICRIRLRGRFRNITIINVHAPTEEKEMREKEQFYDKLDQICGKVQEYDILIVIGDFNAQVGKEEYQRVVAGKFTLQ